MWLRDTVDENASLKILIFNGRINCGDKLLEFRRKVCSTIFDFYV